MSLLDDAIEMQRNTQSQAYQYKVDGFLNMHPEIKRSEVRELAADVEISNATIYRLLKKLGYEGADGSVRKWRMHELAR